MSILILWENLDNLLANTSKMYTNQFTTYRRTESSPYKIPINSGITDWQDETERSLSDKISGDSVRKTIFHPTFYTPTFKQIFSAPLTSAV